MLILHPRMPSLQVQRTSWMEIRALRLNYKRGRGQQAGEMRPNLHQLINYLQSPCGSFPCLSSTINTKSQWKRRYKMVAGFMNIKGVIVNGLALAIAKVTYEILSISSVAFPQNSNVEILQPKYLRAWLYSFGLYLRAPHPQIQPTTAKKYLVEKCIYTEDVQAFLLVIIPWIISIIAV